MATGNEHCWRCSVLRAELEWRAKIVEIIVVPKREAFQAKRRSMMTRDTWWCLEAGRWAPGAPVPSASCDDRMEAGTASPRDWRMIGGRMTGSRYATACSATHDPLTPATSPEPRLCVDACPRQRAAQRGRASLGPAEKNNDFPTPCTPAFEPAPHSVFGLPYFRKVPPSAVRIPPYEGSAHFAGPATVRDLVQRCPVRMPRQSGRKPRGSDAVVAGRGTKEVLYLVLHDKSSSVRLIVSPTSPFTTSPLFTLSSARCNKIHPRPAAWYKCCVPATPPLEGERPWMPPFPPSQTRSRRILTRPYLRRRSSPTMQRYADT
ncbi:hypothetical protein JB92DRAFT_2839077 [Gautieria morchelliformis]|nr:hypothetical protein JB92DRAFT_2839077 [Gautieria morchelliformis]